MADAASASPRPDDLARALREAGLRMTRQRQALIEVLAGATDHPDASELLARVRLVDPSTSLSTVYRTLSVLEGCGLIHRRSFEGAPARFETAADAHHDHIVDLETGAVIEFFSAAIEELQNRIAAEHGYELVHHRMELYCRPRR
jgi:Fur family ferric uptake transcriptional regulator